MYGLALGGQAGVSGVIRAILAELEINMSLTGHASIREIHGKRDSVLVKDDT